VVCSSAGNHAQGFAYACRALGVRGRVYVPAKTPKQKRDRIRYHGGEFIELIVGGSTYDLAAEAALADVARTGATLVPPFDDPRTMAGQGTIAVELLEQLDASRIWWWSPSVAAAALPASRPTWPSGPRTPPSSASSRRARRR
jgi:threonine dehydratase